MAEHPEATTPPTIAPGQFPRTAPPTASHAATFNQFFQPHPFALSKTNWSYPPSPLKDKGAQYFAEFLRVE